MRKNRFFAGAILFLVATRLFAIDPIAWRLDKAFPPQIFVVGGAYTVTYTLQSQLKWPMVHPFVIAKNASSDEFTYVDNCTGKKLVPQEICTVQINLDPVRPGKKRVQIVMQGYDKNQVPLPELVTLAVANTHVSIIGLVVEPLPPTMQVDSSAPYEFRFTNQGTAEATGVSVIANVPGFSTTCTTTLAAGASCLVSGIFTPTSTTPTTQTVTATLSFNQGDAVSVSTSTNVTPLAGLVGELIQGLPDPTIVNINYPVRFRFTNETANPININQNNTFPPEFGSISNGCPNGGAALAAMTSCDISGVFNSAAPGFFQIIAELVPTVIPPAPATVSTQTTTINNTGMGRTVSFVNQCDFPVWFSLNGGNRQNNGANIPCTNSTQCPLGSSCNPSAGGGTGLCFWENYGPTDDNFKLDAFGGGHSSNSVFIPDPGNLGGGIFWSGAISASTGCNGGTCVTANCGNMGGTQSCAPGVGFTQPATQAEITMEVSTVDTYDVEVINGFHIPIQITPNAAIADGYSCGSPGAPVPQNGFGACDWDEATVPNTNYYWVTSGGSSCASGSCPAGQLCGLDIGINKVCGNFLGFWTANQACAINKSKAQPFFGCENWLESPPFPPNTYQLAQMYACATPNASQPTLNSCYLQGAQTVCCGCADWQLLEITPRVTLPNTALCVNKNAQWVRDVQKTLVWMKQACPNYYTYQYDDASSTFTCSNGTPNTQNYTVTFCAGTATGLPAGVTDGRPG